MLERYLSITPVWCDSMSERVVVLGAGYAGSAAIRELESEATSEEIEVVWISEHDYHLLLHEVHRMIRDPDVERNIKIPVEDIKSDSTTFIEDRVTGVDVSDRQVQLESRGPVSYDYLVVALGTATEFYDIEGLEEHAYGIKSVDSARRIHEEIRSVALSTTWDDPARVVIGGAGMSGVQTAGEVAKLRDRLDAPIDITIVEGLDDVLPKGDADARESVRRLLTEQDVTIRTGEFVSRVDDNQVYLDPEGDREPETLPYDVLVWTGGITGREELENVELGRDGRSSRIHANTDLRTDDDRVFAIGDAALVEQVDGEYAPPTSQAAWGAAKVAARNILHDIRDDPLESYDHLDKGTAISIGDETVVYDVIGLPFDTIEGAAGRTLKKAIAARWIVSVSSVKRAVRAWGDM